MEVVPEGAAPACVLPTKHPGDHSLGPPTSGGSGPVTVGSPPPGEITLRTGGGVDVMVFKHNGDIFVRGEKVDNNQEVYREFKEWLAGARHTVPQ